MRFRIKRVLVSLAILVAVISGAQGAEYIDSFDDAPFAGNPTSFTTGDASRGLSYAGSNCDFGYSSGNENVNALALVFPGEASITITSRAGGSFVFKSLYLDTLQAATISGTGDQPFTISVGAGSAGTFSPTAGDRIVNQVQIATVDPHPDFDVIFDTVTVDLAAPEIDIEGNATSIEDGDNTPVATDHTHFGNIVVGESSDRTFTIQNEGDAELTLDGDPIVGLTGSVDFSVETQPAADSIDDGSADLTFVVRCTPSGTGDRTATVSIDNNDSNEHPYTFDVRATGAVPEIDVQGDGISIADGDDTPDPADDTDFGDQDLFGEPVGHTFTIRNTGNAELTLTDPSPFVTIEGDGAGDFEITTIPDSSIDPGGGTTFVIDFDPSVEGDREATISIASDDADEDPYTFDIIGTGTVSPEIDILGDGQIIPNGDTTPDATDGTDFGPHDIAGGIQTHTFTIQNTGSGELTLDGDPLVEVTGPAAGDFDVNLEPVSPVAAVDGETTFEITFDPSALGDREATVSVANDADKDPYTFDILGQGTSAPEMDIQGAGESIPSGDITPAAIDDTDFGDTHVDGATETHTFTIENTGSAQLNLTNGDPLVVVEGDHAIDFTVVQQPAAAITASGGTTTFDVRFDPSKTGLRTATLRIANDDGDENPYTLAIQGTGVFPSQPGAPVFVSQAATATTGNASEVTHSTARVEGTVNPGNTSTTVTFEFGPANGSSPSANADPYPFVAAAEQSPVDGTGILTVHAFLQDLQMDCVYQYRVVATNTNGVCYGARKTFTTQSLERGDLNADYRIDLLDIRICAQIATGYLVADDQVSAQADFNDDGDVDLEDVQLLSAYVLGIEGGDE